MAFLELIIGESYQHSLRLIMWKIYYNMVKDYDARSDVGNQHAG